MLTTAGLADVSLYSYSQKIRDSLSYIRYEIDASNFRDPMNQKVFSPTIRDGRHPDVQKWIQDDKRVAHAIQEAQLLAYSHLRVRKDAFLSIGVMDIHGIWTAPAVMELIAKVLDKEGYKVFTWHRTLMPSNTTVKP